MAWWGHQPADTASKNNDISIITVGPTTIALVAMRVGDNDAGLFVHTHPPSPRGTWVDGGILERPRTAWGASLGAGVGVSGSLPYRADRGVWVRWRYTSVPHCLSLRQSLRRLASLTSGARQKLTNSQVLLNTTDLTKRK